MTHWVIKTSPEDERVARLSALAIGLAVIESAFPSPIPGVKPGLANIVTLLVLARYGWSMAVWVSVLRILGASLFLGSFLTPGFFLSLTGGLCSLAALGVAQYLPERWFGLISWSILAAFAHMSGQLLIVYLGFVPSGGVMNLAPVMAAAALCFGWVNGLIANKLQQHLTKEIV